MNKTWPTLYKKNSNGSIQQWTISVGVNSFDASVYISKEYGQMGGKLQVSEPDYIQGKNIGKANETTAWDQACREAEAQWTKKKTGGKGYVESIESAEAGEKDELVTGGIDVMLAHTYGTIINEELDRDKAKRIKFPAFAQPKLNGHRCVATVVNGVCTLWTRTRKPIVSMPHIIAAIEARCAELGIENLVLDGELYNHDYNEHLEDLSSLIRPEYVKDGHEVVQYHVYDNPNGGTFETRLAALNVFFTGMENYGVALCQVLTVTVNDEDQLVSVFNKWRHEGYEGAIIRNADSLYEGKRSYGLQKLKGWHSKEFAIVDVEEGRGKMAGKAVMICVTGEDDPVPGVQFSCSLAASQERRAEVFQNKSDYVGKLLSVKFAYYTQQGVPFHLVGEAIRDYE